MRRPLGCESHRVGSTLHTEHVVVRRACRARSWAMICTDPLMYATRIAYSAEPWGRTDVAEAFGVDEDDVAWNYHTGKRWATP